MSIPVYRKNGPIWRRWPDPPLREVWTRTVDTRGGTETVEIVRNEGLWCQPVGDRFVPLPGARDFTVAEYVGNRTRRTHRYGEWVEVGADVAGSVEPLRVWCLRVCNSQLPAGGFRFAPAVWRERSREPLAIPFVPEFDHPDPALRTLAATERQHRVLVSSLKSIERLRREQIRTATAAGHSRRALGNLLGLSFARIQQLVRE